MPLQALNAYFIYAHFIFITLGAPNYDLITINILLNKITQRLIH